MMFIVSIYRKGKIISFNVRDYEFLESELRLFYSVHFGDTREFEIKRGDIVKIYIPNPDECMYCVNRTV